MASSRPPNVVLQDIPAQWRYPDRAPTPALAHIRRVNRRGRLLAALKALGGCWLAAVAAVFLPLLHFILVPGLLLLGPAMFAWKLGERVTLLSADGACPACGERVEHRVKLRASEHTHVRCDHCGRGLELALPAEALAADD